MKNLGDYLFLADLMSEVFKAMREHRTVIPFEYRRHGGDMPALQLEVRVTRLGDMRLPASREALSRKQYTERVMELNARDFAKRSDQRVRPGRKAAPDDDKQ